MHLFEACASRPLIYGYMAFHCAPTHTHTRKTFNYEVNSIKVSLIVKCKELLVLWIVDFLVDVRHGRAQRWCDAREFNRLWNGVDLALLPPDT